MWILFEESNGKKKFYPGEIKEYKMKLKDDGSPSVEHFVVFDDGDESWHDLQQLEREGELCWTEPPSRQVSKRVAPTLKEEEDTQQGNKEKKARPVKMEEMEEDVSTEEEDNDKKARPVKMESLEEDATNGDARDVTATEPFQSLNPKMKAWIRKIGLQNAYGTGDEDLRAVSESNYVKPNSFEQLFLLTDYLYPGNDYHLRLFETQSRPGLKVRKILRDLKKKNPDDLLVSWHQHRAEWIPPTKFAMVGIVKIIRDCYR